MRVEILPALLTVPFLIVAASALGNPSQRPWRSVPIAAITNHISAETGRLRVALDGQNTAISRPTSATCSATNKNVAMRSIERDRPLHVLLIRVTMTSIALPRKPMLSGQSGQY